MTNHQEAARAHRHAAALWRHVAGRNDEHGEQWDADALDAVCATEAAWEASGPCRGRTAHEEEGYGSRDSAVRHTRQAKRHEAALR